MRKIALFSAILMLLGTSVFLGGCTIPMPGSPGTDAQLGQLSLLLTDAPVDGAKEVNITVDQVSVAKVNAEGITEWQTVSNAVQTFNLLELQNTERLFAENRLPAGHYEQIRLRITNANMVTNDGVSHEISLRDVEQTGLKLVREFDVPAEGITTLLLDFDARRSVIKTAGGQGQDASYMLKPTIRVMNRAMCGSLAGIVSPASVPDGTIVINVKDETGTDIVATAVPDSQTGAFTIRALEAGTYLVEVTIEDAAGVVLKTQTVGTYPINTGEKTDIGTITLTI